jgi:hypothetical protein
MRMTRRIGLVAVSAALLAGCASSGQATDSGDAGQPALMALTVRVGVTGGPAVGPSGQSAVSDAPKQGVQVRAGTATAPGRYSGRTDASGIVVLHVPASGERYRVSVPSCIVHTTVRISGPRAVHLDCQVP